MMREYILRHRHPEKRDEAHPILQEIMPDTYGVMVYQEDVIKVAHHFAGLSLAEADILRRGMSGKFRSRSEFQQIQEKFESNCLQRGYSPELTKEIWIQIESFAGYAFSKGHSASYAVESYQSLYLKAYYPLEYMLATINNFGGFYRTEIYIHEARKLGAIIEPPSLNLGNYESTLINKTMYLGFNLVAGIEAKIILNVLNERNNNGAFSNFNDLMKRTFLPLEQLILVIRIGALRDFPESKKELLWRAHLFHNKIKTPTSQPQLFDQPTKDFTFPALDEEELEDAFEQLELFGFPLCSPFKLVKQTIPDFIQPFETLERNLGLKTKRYGYLVTAKRTRTIKGEHMFFGTFIDQEGNYFDTIHFPEIARKYPFRGIVVYEITGVVRAEFDVYTIQVGVLVKLPYCEDPRYAENATTTEKQAG
jgi:DNA polymerase-3 subunit alpha